MSDLPNQKKKEKKNSKNKMFLSINKQIFLLNLFERMLMKIKLKKFSHNLEMSLLYVYKKPNYHLNMHQKIKSNFVLLILKLIQWLKKLFIKAKKVKLLRILFILNIVLKLILFSSHNLKHLECNI